MKNIETIEEEHWICQSCGCTNYCLRDYCIYCLENNRISNAEKQKDTLGIEDKSDNNTKGGITKEGSFLSDLAFKEIIDESQYFLYGSNFRRFIKRYEYLIRMFEKEEGEENNKLMFLYAQLAIVREQTFSIKKAAELYENALTIWDKRYRNYANDYPKFLMLRLSYCFSSSYDIPDCGPVYRPRKAKRYFNKLYRLYKEQYGKNSLEFLSICIDLTKFEYGRFKELYGTSYLIDSLEIHRNLFEDAVNRLCINDTMTA